MAYQFTSFYLTPEQCVKSGNACARKFGCLVTDCLVDGVKYGSMTYQDESFLDIDAVRTAAEESLRKVLAEAWIIPAGPTMGMK